jgi:hypothetical protein
MTDLLRLPGEDDPTPPVAPMRLENIPALAVLSDLILCVHEHTRTLRELARQVRLSTLPISAELRLRMAEEIESFHTRAAAHGQRLREAA